MGARARTRADVGTQAVRHDEFEWKAADGYGQWDAVVLAGGGTTLVVGGETGHLLVLNRQQSPLPNELRTFAMGLIRDRRAELWDG